MDEWMHLNAGLDRAQVYHSLPPPNLNCWWATLWANSCPLVLLILVWLTIEISHTSTKAKETWIIILIENIPIPPTLLLFLLL